MGCDISLYVEHRVDGKWRSADTWTQLVEQRIDKSGQTIEERIDLVDLEYAYYRHRNYQFFALLANVRNFQNVVPFAAPRGLPNEMSDEVKSVARDEPGYHSHSYFTVAELMSQDWTLPQKCEDYVGIEEFMRWNHWGRQHGERPDPWPFRIHNTTLISEEEMQLKAVEYEALRDDARKIVPVSKSVVENPFQKFCDFYCLVSWDGPRYQIAHDFLSKTMPRLWKLGAPEDVRIVFWFDE